MKRCSICRLSIDEGAIFGKNQRNKDGLSYRCKKCKSKFRRRYYNSEKGIACRNLYEQSEKRKEYLKKYSQSEKHKKNQKEYKRSKKGKETLRKYLQSNTYKESEKKYHQSQKYKKTRKKYLQSKGHKEYLQSKKYKDTLKRKYEKNKISHGLSASIRKSLKGNKNGHHWEDLVGWTLQQFKNRFNQLFKPGMTWKNHGIVWEIDHIEPLSVHNITSIDCTDFKRAWKLSNLQPLFKKENTVKSNNLEKHFQPTLF